MSWGFMCLAVIGCAVMMAGCASWRGTTPVVQNELVNHYNRLAANAAVVDPCIQSLVPPPSLGDGRPLTHPNVEDRWPISLQEAIAMGVEKNAIIRQNAQFLSPNNPLLRSPDSNPSIYDPDIQNNGILFGQRGIGAAASDFDPRWTTTAKTSRDENVQNSLVQAPPDNVLVNEQVQYQSRLEQQLLTGGTFAVTNTWNYLQTNQPETLFGSTYTGTLGAELRQPLWAGSGKSFTEIAGPIAQKARGFSNVSQGIVIAHINKRLSDIDFQENLVNFVREIGDVYWDLYHNYQDYDAARQTSKVAKKLWDYLDAIASTKNRTDVAQSEDAYWESKGREEMALSTLFLTEAKLRRLLGLPLDDSRLLYPSDEAREEGLTLNRSTCLYEALVNRLELTRQKTNIHSLELQLSAARQLVAPKLDLIAGYSLNGFGNRFYNPNPSDTAHTPVGYNSATSNLFSGKENSWDIGFEYSIPLWLRQERAQVRQLELRIVKARATLAVQEDEIAHELNSVIMTIDRAVSVSKINRRRLRAARERVDAAKSELESGYKSIDGYLRSLNAQTAAQVEYYKAITELNKSLRDLLYRMGRLLSADGISLLGVDGLPLLPPPEPAEPPEILPMPSGPDKKPGEEKNDSDPAIPPPPAKPRVASGRVDLTNESNDDDTSDFRLPRYLSMEQPPELSEDIPSESESSSVVNDWSEPAEVEDDQITPVSEQR